MENVSDSRQQVPKRTHQHELWIIDLAIVTFAAFTTCYVIVALITHEVKKSNPVRKGRARLMREKRLATFTKALSGFIAFLSLLYASVKIWLLVLQYNATHAILVPESDKQLCNVLPRVAEFTISITTGLCYLFLWARQSVFYLSPALAALNNARVKFFSYSVVIFWIIYYIPIATVQVILVKHEYKQPGGCTIVESSLPTFRIVIISWVTVSCVMQVALLWLFVNPILNRTSIRGHTNTKHIGPSRSYLRVYQRVKRAFILTAICLVSDIISAIASMLLYRRESNNITSLYSLNLVINLLALIICFDNWRTMLWPWCQTRKTSTVHRHSISITATAQSSPYVQGVAVNADISIVSSREI